MALRGKEGAEHSLNLFHQNKGGQRHGHLQSFCEGLRQTKHPTQAADLSPALETQFCHSDESLSCVACLIASEQFTMKAPLRETHKDGVKLNAAAKLDIYLSLSPSSTSAIKGRKGGE